MKPPATITRCCTRDPITGPGQWCRPRLLLPVLEALGAGSGASRSILYEWSTQSAEKLVDHSNQIDDQ